MRIAIARDWPLAAQLAGHGRTERSAAARRARRLQLGAQLLHFLELRRARAPRLRAQPLQLQLQRARLLPPESALGPSDQAQDPQIRLRTLEAGSGPLNL